MILPILELPDTTMPRPNERTTSENGSSSRLPALNTRRVAKLRAVCLAEMTRRMKTANGRHTRDRCIGIAQQLTRPPQPQREVIMRRRNTQEHLEHALQMTLRKLHQPRKLFKRQRLLNVRLHQPHHFNQLGTRKANAGIDGNMLVISRAAKDRKSTRLNSSHTVI